ncbi:MAG: FtsW/RodA/SpoVE family cell cycle protein [Fimbriimonadales bacterium]
MRSQLKRQMDWPLLISTLLLMSAGLLALWSASAVQANHDDFKSQVEGIVLSMPIFLVFLFVDPRVWRHYSKFIFIFTIGLLLLVWVPGIGRSGGGAERWITLGPVGLQPSEIAKLLVILTLADCFHRYQTHIRSLKFLGLTFLHVLPAFALVAAQPSLSTSLVFIAIWVAMSIVAGQNLKYLATIAAIGVALFAFAWQSDVIRPYQKERVKDYVSGELGFHTERSLASVGSGRFIGEGFARGPLKEAKYVPEATTDFIFTVVAEEGGFVGSSLLIGLYGFFLFRVWLVAMNANFRFYRYVATGIFTVFAFHTLVNLFVVLGVFPVTGVPLPFVSFGRTAMLLSLAAVGLLLNIRGREKQLVF